MKISSNFCSDSSGKLALTIGYFDGVHLGHQALLHRLKEVASSSALITFSNHPGTILHKKPITHLTTLTHRLALFETMGINQVFLIPFSEAFADQTARSFLTELKKSLPFTHLILGHDAVIGSDRNGDLADIARSLNFHLEYLDPVQINGKVVSSSEIRKCILAGNLIEAGKFLGRPYSIFATVQHGAGLGGALGFHTANLPVEELALPPLGVYAVEVKLAHETLPGVANLGHAPTLHTNRPTCLEVHLIETERTLYGQTLEVFFHHFLRPEKRFDSVDALKMQINQDIEHAKALMSSTL